VLQNISIPFLYTSTRRQYEGRVTGSLVLHTVDAQLGVSDNLLDLAICLEISERFPCKRTVNLQTIDEGGNGDEAVGLDILLELVVGLLVEHDGVLGLVLDCTPVSGRLVVREVTERAVS
jgi:hypothetical protein